MTNPNPVYCNYCKHIIWNDNGFGASTNRHGKYSIACDECHAYWNRMPILEYKTVFGFTKSLKPKETALL